MMQLTPENMNLWRSENPSWWWIMPIHEKEIEWINKSGIARNRQDKSRGMKSRTHDDKDKWNIAGVAGEWAASMVYNIPIGCVLGKTMKEFHAGDLVKGTIKIEAKSNISNVPNLWNLVVNDDAIKLDRPYVVSLFCLFPQAIPIIGWAWGDEIWNRGRKTTGPIGQPIHILDKSNLRTPTSLFDEIRKSDIPVLQSTDGTIRRPAIASLR